MESLGNKEILMSDLISILKSFLKSIVFKPVRIKIKNEE